MIRKIILLLIISSPFLYSQGARIKIKNKDQLTVYYAKDLQKITFTPCGVNSVSEEPKAEIKDNDVIKIFPNPFSTDAKIELNLKVSGLVDVSVIDAFGVVITPLKSDYLDKGLHTLVWSGVNQQGNKVSNGIYFVRLKIGNSIFTQKLILIN